jgi:small subunit ribosomal protein S9
MEKIHKIGRRKASIARIYLSKGNGNVKINNKDLNNYFSTDGLKSKINLPFIITETLGKYDLSVNVSGGGNTGQADAIKLAVSRALCEVNEEYRPLLKKEGLLTRDSRVVERKKPGQKKARKKFQWVKR